MRTSPHSPSLQDGKVITLSLYDCTVMTIVREGERQKRCWFSNEFWIIAATPTQLLEQRTKTSKKTLYGSIGRLRGIPQGKG